MSTKIRTIFIGTSEFGLPALQRLMKASDFAVVALITQPDKKVGRQQILTHSPVKKFALANDLAVYQPEKIEKMAVQIEALEPDLIIVAAYAQKLPKGILAIPKYGCLNIHGSLLPRYRGAACVQAAILNGDQETGVSIIKMDAGIDTGPIIKQEKLTITGDETAGSLHDKLSVLAADFLIPALRDYFGHKLTLKPQDEKQASYVKTLDKADGHIDWNRPADKMERFIRAMQPWPGAFSYLPGEHDTMLKIIKVEKQFIDDSEHPAGQLFLSGPGLAVKCADRAILIKQLQPEGKKIILAGQFLNGYKKYLNVFLK